MNNVPEAFSCGFFSESLNFNVTNLGQAKNDTNPVARLVIDFLERGYPTRPTHYLASKLKEEEPNFSWEKIKDVDPILLRPFNPDYSLTIKGSEENQLLPAQTFFNQLIDEHLPDYSFIKNLLIPECKFSDILAFDIKDLCTIQDFLGLPNFVCFRKSYWGFHGHFHLRERASDRGSECLAQS